MDLIYLIKVIIIAIVEGITEFLPISSTGHMIIFSDLLNLESTPFLKMFLVVIQVGAIMAVVVLYRKRLANTLKPENLKPGKVGFAFWTKIAIAIIPAGVIGLLFDDIIEENFMTSITVAFALIIGAILMIVCENRFRKNAKVMDVDEISYKQAFIVGAFQTLAILFPGFSRSASSIIGGWIMGFSTVVAAEFSFFLAIPTMLLGSGYKLYKYEGALTVPEIGYIIVGLIVSFIVAYFVIEKFISYLQKMPMRIFAIYRVLVGLVILTMFFL
ncbi:undecaprenyl-diphosphate phosphatase [Erysipelotrichaceae bacterium OttesenSCG-928-M19]|nr:undecaprenyl-diphosphate phosphatase [Erysipelotrichaceae bacterium OttesenSCG-928-M19]